MSIPTVLTSSPLKFDANLSQGSRVLIEHTNKQRFLFSCLDLFFVFIVDVWSAKVVLLLIASKSSSVQNCQKTI